jgi:hypothetical protein
MLDKNREKAMSGKESSSVERKRIVIRGAESRQMEQEIGLSFDCIARAGWAFRPVTIARPSTKLSRGRSGRTLIERALQETFDEGKNKDYGSVKQLKSSIWRTTGLTIEQPATRSTGATGNS